jgi:uncharacterized RDD family membrane protein YckC
VATVFYRCVCGETISLDTAQGGACDQCGRHFRAEVLREAFAATVSVPDPSSASTTQSAASNEDDSDALIGQTLGHYRIVGKLGQGGMGTVYRALDDSLERYVAIKVIDPKKRSVADTRQLQILFREAIAQARVNHPNVVHIYFVGRDEDPPFLAMELVGGSTLADRLETGSLPYAEVIEIGLQLTDALRHSVNFDIIHCDIKPSNVLLTETGRVKLSDFGLAKRLSQTPDEDTELVGTPDYMAPEVIQGAAADARSDLYSLGVTLFEMTFGRLPYSFSSGNVLERLAAHQQSPIEFPDPWPDDVPHAWRNVLNRLMAKSPDDRYQNYDEFMGDLRKLRPGNPPKAGRIQRGLAWFVDLLLVQSIFGLLTFAITNEDMQVHFEGRPVAALMIALFSAIAPLLASVVQAFWGITPGKKIFQLRIVDRHGLGPNRATLAIRMATQVLTIWAGVLFLVLSALGLRPLGFVVTGVLQAGWLVDAGFAVFRRDGRSLHDLFFGTRVVLDARSTPHA